MVLKVSFATVLQQSENVLPCYNIVQNQIRPEVQETPGRCEAQLTIAAYSIIFRHIKGVGVCQVFESEHIAGWFGSG